MKRPFLYNRPLAVILSTLVVLLTLVLCGGQALLRERGRVEGIFYTGVNGDNLSIYTDLMARSESAYNLLTMAQRKFSPSDPMLAQVESARQELLNSETISQRYAANQRLNDAVEALYTALTDPALDWGEEGYLILLQYKDFTSRNETIGHDGFNAAAQAFNASLSPFPANMIAALRGIEPIELYR